MIIDFHSHILPGIDDGAKNIEESVALLDKLAENNTDIVVATPHFYCQEQSVSQFIENRNAAYEKLKPYIKPEHPKILLGAEVLYNPVLISNDILYDLKIQGTNYMLLEMPYTKIDSVIIENVAKIADFMDIKLIIAHIERYLHFTSFKSLTQLMNLDVLGQINVKSLTDKISTRRACFKLIKMGYVQALGTDIHRMSRPVPFIKDAFPILDKKFGSSFTEKLMKNELDILNDADIDHFF
ncbi:MAG: CpsB/CapC family capsule biosynthesis tyrosine phosphatase [Oscillospiraceae bacterium]